MTMHKIPQRLLEHLGSVRKAHDHHLQWQSILCVFTFEYLVLTQDRAAHTLTSPVQVHR